MNSHAVRRLVLAGALAVGVGGVAAVTTAGRDGRASTEASAPDTTTSSVTTLPTSTTATTAPPSTAPPTTGPPTTVKAQPPEPSPGSVPALAGPPDQVGRPSAKKMARLGGFLNDYWSRQFARGLYPTGKWRPVLTLRIADHPLRCGGRQYDTSPSHVFCGPDYFVGLSVQDYDELRGEGDDTPTPRRYTPELSLWIAHEWGHAAQWSGGTTQRPVMERELESDCFAGAFLAHARRLRILPPEEYDLRVIEAELRSAGDDFSPPSPGDEHGTGDQRWAAFLRGWKGAADDCSG